ncbi:MAG: SAM-dependent methyltransferase, partial [Polyangiales bacterium]
VVILGAGLDARAVRLAGELGGVTVFEVDHPATQAYKRDALARVGASSPARYVAWNFERDPLERLADALAAVGHDRATPTFTVWEGVTMYLTRAAIESTLAAVRDYGPVGSELVLNYVDRARAEGRGPASRVVGRVVRGVGEPFVSGFEHAEMASLLERAGFAVSRNASLSVWAKALLPVRWGDRVGLGGNLAVARRTA